MHFAWQIIKATYTYSEYVNTYRSSTAMMVTQRHLNATLYVHCLCCWTTPVWHMPIFSETWLGHKTQAGRINLWNSNRWATQTKMEISKTSWLSEKYI